MDRFVDVGNGLIYFHILKLRKQEMIMKKLPSQVSEALVPLFEELPLSRALECLIVTGASQPALVDCVESVLQDRALDSPILQAGIWLFIDDLDRSHQICQGIDNATGSFWHGIMHRREGDFSNSHYWFNQVGDHPAISAVGGYDPHKYIKAVETLSVDTEDVGHLETDLINLQRREWETLFIWSATEYQG